MSGIEAAGLILGAVPILIEAIDRYRSGVNKISLSFKKRKKIEKLGRALKYQTSIIELITQQVLALSGCDDTVLLGANNVQLRLRLHDKHTQQMVSDFLGVDNARVFSDKLLDCMADIENATIGLASLVPELAIVRENIDVQAVLNANAGSKRGQIQFSKRFSAMFKLEPLEDKIAALDQSTNMLDKFMRNVTTDHQLGQNTPSRKAIKLAKALQVVRQSAVNLHRALRRQWVAPCHQRHKLNVFLEDRLIEPKLKQIQTTKDAEGTRFQVVFVGSMTKPTDLWHEALFYIEAEDLQPTDLGASSPQIPRVRVSTPQGPATTSRLDVPDICAALTGAACKAQYPTFYLTSTTDITMTLNTRLSAIAQNVCASSTTLNEIFQDRHNQNSHSSPLSWKWRMDLALKVASSFLQFTRTPWIQHSWSAKDIHVPFTTSSNDPKRAFLSAEFSSNCPSLVDRQAKEDFLRLGVLLLEIWHEDTLESRFAQQLSTTKNVSSSFMLRACALEWLEDTKNPLPDLYFCAVRHCVSGLVTPNSLSLEWDDPDLWKSVCENVINPLSKVAKI